MQNLFAYYQAKEANFLLAEDYVKEKLQPNLNLDVPEKKIEMAEKEKEALSILHKWKIDKSPTIDTEDDRIDDVIDFATSKFEKDLQKDSRTISQKMVIEVENLHKYYIKLLLLIIEFSNVKEDTNLSNNKIVDLLRNNKELSSELIKKDVSWGSQLGLIKKIYINFLAKEPEFDSYQVINSPTIEEDRNCVNFIIKNIIFAHEDLIEYLESEDLYWEENKNILKSMVRKSIKDAESNTLLKISQNWDDDKDFFKKLFNETLINDDNLNELITKHSKNWKKDRLALTDVIILKMGVTEMLNFPSIPVKVSINEYIEVSKTYSTPKSKQFINGLLDKFADVLQSEGKIKKSGRGLIDNK